LVLRPQEFIIEQRQHRSFYGLFLSFCVKFTSLPFHEDRFPRPFCLPRAPNLLHPPPNRLEPRGLISFFRHLCPPPLLHQIPPVNEQRAPPPPLFPCDPGEPFPLYAGASLFSCMGVDATPISGAFDGLNACSFAARFHFFDLSFETFRHWLSLRNSLFVFFIPLSSITYPPPQFFLRNHVFRSKSGPPPSDVTVRIFCLCSCLPGDRNPVCQAPPPAPIPPPPPLFFLRLPASSLSLISCLLGSIFSGRKSPFPGVKISSFCPFLLIALSRLSTNVVRSTFLRLGLRPFFPVLRSTEFGTFFPQLSPDSTDPPCPFSSSFFFAI